MELSSKKLFGDYVKDFKLFAHQVPPVEWMRSIEYRLGIPNEFKGGVLADDMGLGKTRISSAVAAASPVPKTLVLCPPTTRYNWIEELLKCVQGIYVFTIEGDKYVHCTLQTGADGVERVIDAPLNKKTGMNLVSPCILVCNYQLISSGVKNDKLVTEHSWDRIIIDEAHFLRNETATWEKIDGLRQPMIITNGVQHRLGSRWCVTGTPIQMGKGDLVNIFRFCDNRFLRGKTERDWSEELRWLISTRLFRRNRDQLTPYLKKLMKYPENEADTRIINVNIPDTQLSQQIAKLSYEQLCHWINQDHQEKGFRQGNLIDAILSDEKAFLITLTTEAKYLNSKTASGSFTESEQLRKIISYPYITIPVIFQKLRPGRNEYKGKMSKIDEIMNIIIGGGGKSFVLFHHYETISIKLEEMISRRFPMYRVLKINGSVKSDRERYNIVKEANSLIEQNRPVILLSSMMATSEGVNYQAFSQLISVDPEYNPKTQDQANSRVQRIGQQNKVTIYEIYLNDFEGFYGNISVDKRIKDIRDERSSISDIIDLHNAAWTFKRLYYRNSEGQVESGVIFNPQFEQLPPGTINGPDSVGPSWLGRDSLELFV